jgi:hypothetical protein
MIPAGSRRDSVPRSGLSGITISFQKMRAQYHHLIMCLVVGGTHQCHRTAFQRIPQRLQRRSPRFQFLPVATAKLCPSSRVMSEPATQSVARRHVEEELVQTHEAQARSSAGSSNKSERARAVRTISPTLVSIVMGSLVAVLAYPNRLSPGRSSLL